MPTGYVSGVQEQVEPSVGLQQQTWGYKNEEPNVAAEDGTRKHEFKCRKGWRILCADVFLMLIRSLLGPSFCLGAFSTCSFWIPQQKAQGVPRGRVHFEAGYWGVKTDRQYRKVEWSELGIRPWGPSQCLFWGRWEQGGAPPGPGALPACWGRVVENI